MTHPYVELHAHSNFSILEGASHPHEMVAQAKRLGYPALALTDHDTLAGAMVFAQTARGLDLHPIMGTEITLTSGHHILLLARTRTGYGNLSRLLSHAHVTNERRKPQVDPALLPDYAGGLTLLTGCRNGEVPALLMAERYRDAEARLRDYRDWFGAGNVYVELQQNRAHGDMRRTRRLVALARETGLPIVATNNAHYHRRERHRLHDCLIAISRNKSLSATMEHHHPTRQFYLKSPEEMAALFAEIPDALTNTLVVAEQCGFDLVRDLDYRFPDHPVPSGHTQQSYLEELCYQAAQRRYGEVTEPVSQRLQEEFRLIRKHNLAGFLLIYHEIIQEARQIMIDLGLSDPEIPLEERPPGRGRGSSVALLVGYLIGLSHIDPLQFHLRLERFLPDDMISVPDIDLDFPRNIREALIERVHQRWGWEKAALTGMVQTYKIRGAVRDLGKALGLPRDQLDRLAKSTDHAGADELGQEMGNLPAFKSLVTAPIWRDFIDLAAQLDGFPRALAQHPGGMVIGSSPLTEIVPIHRGAIEGRYVMEWDKDDIDAAGFVKIDFLALGALSQMQDALGLIEQREGRYIDLSRIDFEDKAVYDMLHRADTVGIFQVESAAQMQVLGRLKPMNLFDMAFEVAAVRPGVGANDGVRHFIRRRLGYEQWDYDHPSEEPALERTLGVILYQDQVNEVAIHVAGFSSANADQMRRAFNKRHNTELLDAWREKFLHGAAANGVGKDTALTIFAKFNGQYMFPESHAYAFGITAYQMAWLKYYHPLEFNVGLFNQQPMGFWSLETLKQDARRHGVLVLNPHVNRSMEKCTVDDGALRLGLQFVADVGSHGARAIVEARQSGEPFASLADLMERTRLQQTALMRLADAGALDCFGDNRHQLKWEIGLRYRPVNDQLALRLPVAQDHIQIQPPTAWENMLGEYRAMGIYPGGHVMERLRPDLPRKVVSSRDIYRFRHDTEITVAGLVVRRQRPMGKTVFVTLEDEFGFTPIIVWPSSYGEFRQVIREPLLQIRGKVSRREGTLNIVMEHAEPIAGPREMPKSRDWM